MNFSPGRKNKPQKYILPMGKILVDISRQRLTLFGDDGNAEKEYPCSTSRFGPGNAEGSEKTPVGLHRIAEKYGDGEPLGMIFSSREPTGKTAAVNHSPTPSGADLITTRILRLEGLQPGLNKGRGIDSYERYIYIHGTPEEGLIGTPASHGCIRMKNDDIAELYPLCPVGLTVEII
ncbi:MAG: hypothetical protein DBY00_09260 [Flavobacteriales bacterium]|nr:MAG: hypothetical protein DBY00_09260 [Flavobacteriales bacterium]